MDQRTWNALRRPIEIVVSAALVLIVLTACGGDDDDDPATEAIETVQPGEAATPASDGEADVDGAVTASPADVAIAVPGGTPTIIDGAMPGDAPSGGATPADSVAGATPAVAAPGDGTGGAPPEAAGEEPAGDAAVVDSCAVTMYPPYTGDSPVQVTTTEVNFRAGPGTDCDTPGKPLPTGTVVEMLSDPVTREGDEGLAWVAVTVGGTEGWIATDFLEPAE